MPPRPPGTASRSSRNARAASTARLRRGRGENRSQILRPSSTAMKKLFQKRPRQLKGSGTRENRRLVSSRGTGQSSSSERCGGGHLTGLRARKKSSGTQNRRRHKQRPAVFEREKSHGGRKLF